MADKLTDQDDMTLRIMAIVEGTTIAEQRRRALAAYAASSRQDPDVAEIVCLALEYGREIQYGSRDVISMRERRC